MSKIRSIRCINLFMMLAIEIMNKQIGGNTLIVEALIHYALVPHVNGNEDVMN